MLSSGYRTGAVKANVGLPTNSIKPSNVILDIAEQGLSSTETLPPYRSKLLMQDFFFM